MLNAKEELPRYQVVHDDLRQRIQLGEFPVGCRIPPENELVQHYAASIATIRKAVQLLCDDGLLCKRRPVGTFVIGVPHEFPPSGPLRSEGNRRIGILMPDMRDMLPEGDSRHWQLYLRRLKGIFEAAASCGMTILLHDLSDGCDWGQFDGWIIVRWRELYHDEPFDTIARELEEKRIPYVVISDFVFRLSARWWVVDNLGLEFFRAFRFLGRNGARKILYIGSFCNLENPRYAALEQAARLFQWHYQALEVTEPNRENAYAAVADYCRDGIGVLLQNFDTIFCSTDLQALGVMQYLLENNVAIPGQISLMGCDNIMEAATAPVPLTTFEFSGKHTGKLAVELMNKALAFPDAAGEMAADHGEILVRASVRLNHTKE